MEHLSFTNLDVKGTKCNCSINQDHKNSSISDINDGYKYWVRKDMYHPWIAVKGSTPKSIYPMWVTEEQKNQIIANWEKTGTLGFLIPKLRSAENTKHV